jgi:polyisoprenyl-teichoic acid--peptidoglycan teichoic acid transferase
MTGALGTAGPERRSPSGTLRRYLLGSATIALCTTVAIAVIVIGAVSTIASDIALGGKPLKSPQLTASPAGVAQTIMVIGDDHIGPTTTYSTGAYETVNGSHLLHADTFMLVRMDPAQGQTSILSIPRDLLVSFSWHGQHYTGKFNSTYAVGRAELVLKVVAATLPGITINHVVDVNFASFLGLVDAIGCVYVDVGQRYFNPPGGTYQPINIQPGYQRLCGKNALAYVRYRHTDSDFVRVARQQDFLRQAKEQLGIWGFLTRYDELAKAFGRAVRTDIHGTSEVTQLLQLAFFSLSRPVRQVPFQIDNATFPFGNQVAVTSTPRLIHASVADFLYQHPKAVLQATAVRTTHRRSRRRHTTATAASSGLIPLSAGVRASALAMTVRVPFPVYLPSLQTIPALPNDFHAYAIRDELNHVHHGYRIDWQVNGIGGYYGIEGMDWANPPLFNTAIQTRIGGRTYLVVQDGAHIHDIGWRVGGDIYWVSNTLQENLTKAQMLAIANSAQPVA